MINIKFTDDVLPLEINNLKNDIFEFGNFITTQSPYAKKKYGDLPTHLEYKCHNCKWASCYGCGEYYKQLTIDDDIVFKFYNHRGDGAMFVKDSKALKKFIKSNPFKHC